LAHSSFLKLTILFLLGLLLLSAGFASYSELRLVQMLRNTNLCTGTTGIQWSDFLQPDGKEDRLILGLIFLRNGKPYSSLLRRPGFVGGLIRVLIESLQKSSASHPNSPFIGLHLVPCLLAFSAIFDALMLEGESSFRPISVVVACLAAVIAWENAWTFLTTAKKEILTGDPL
jgi:hypothetical protein